jgi:hypothetical protein
MRKSVGGKLVSHGTARQQRPSWNVNILYKIVKIEPKKGAENR